MFSKLSRRALEECFVSCHRTLAPSHPVGFGFKPREVSRFWQAIRKRTAQERESTACLWIFHVLWRDGTTALVSEVPAL